MKELGTWCAYVGTRRPSAQTFRVPHSEHRDYAWVKPEGGMWTSPYEGEFGSPWCQWCLSEEFHVTRAHPYFHLWLLDPDPKARIYVIDSVEALAKLVKRYPGKKLDSGYPWQYPDWLTVAKDYDGVHLTEEAQWATRFSDGVNLYGWDCESTLWLRWKFLEVKELGPTPIEMREYVYD